VSPLAERIHSALPQTQCTRCGYDDCAAYARAVAGDEAPINQCPPGGAEGIVRLSALTGRPALPLNPENGLEGPRAVAVIDEAWCIGCTLCMPVCPTDAILGSNKRMHTVIEPDCTGCELCIAVCPVDCISLENVTGERTGWNAWSAAQAGRALQRYESHRARLDIGPAPQAEPADDEAARKRAVIEAALARSRATRG
jgi:Na+-translocating ferredoxin:NAD+ oxidoreductase subunit B